MEGPGPHLAVDMPKCLFPFTGGHGKSEDWHTGLLAVDGLGNLGAKVPAVQ